MMNSRSQFLKEIINYETLISFIENLIHKKIEKLLSIEICFDEDSKKVIIIEAIIDKEQVRIDCVSDVNLEKEE